MLNQLLETIIQILTGWLDKFNSHAQHVEDKLDSLDQTASDIETNTDPIPDIRDNTAAVITPIQNIKSNTDSIKTSSQTSANNTTAILNNISTLSTNTGRAAAFAEDCANNTLDIKDKVTTIASDTTQLRADTDELNTMSDKIYEAIKWSLADKYIDETESGPSPMSFDTDTADDLKSLIIGIIGSQSGSGDPSPSNIRSFNTYSNANIVVNGNTLQIAFGQNVYKGYVDAVSGKLVIEYAVKILNDPTAWRTSGSTVVTYYYNMPALFNDRYLSNNSTDYLECSAFPVMGSSATVNFARWTSSTSYLFGVKLNTSYTLSDLETLTSSGDLAVSYKLATPVEVQLTAQQIAAVKGVNTISSDTNGDIEVTYKESIKHYLDKQDN